MTLDNTTPPLPTYELVQQVFSSLKEIVCVLDTEGRFIYINDACFTLWGYTPSELIGRLCFEFILPEDHETSIKATVIGGQEIPAFENRYYRKDRSIAYMSWEGVWDTKNRLIYGTGRDITEKKKQQEEQLRQEEQQQKMITNAVIKATEEERSFVGRELHDNVNQVLTTVKLYTELCLAGHGDQVELLKRSMVLLQESINEIRGLSKRLSAPSLGDIRLKDSIQELVEAINATNRFQIEFDYQLGNLDTSPDMHLAIYRILQEHFTNIIKHAQATQVLIQLFQEAGQLKMIIKDNGIGFEPLQYRKGIGVANMTNRAESINGSLQLYSIPGEGCKLELIVPLSANQTERNELPE